MSSRATLLVAVVASALAFSGVPRADANLRCSTLQFSSARFPDHPFFVGTVLYGTVSSTRGSVNDASSSWPPEAPRAIRGYRLAVERVGRPWRSLLPPETREVVVVPWTTYPDCAPLAWPANYPWLAAGTRGVFDATLRPREFWTGGVPTLDAYSAHDDPYTAPLTGDSGRSSSLSLEEYLSLVEVLPLMDSVERFPDAAAAGLFEWVRTHPSLAARHPADVIANYVRWDVREARVQLVKSPVVGTFRFTFTFVEGDSVELFARTQDRPDHSDAVRNEQPTGYTLNTHYSRSADSLSTDFPDGRANGWNGVSLKPFAENADSAVYDGSIDVLARSLGLTPRPNNRGLPERLTTDARNGRWIVFPNGRVRFAWNGPDRSRTIASIRGERISMQVISYDR